MPQSRSTAFPRHQKERWGTNKDQGPVVQSVVSLTSSLRVISLTVLADSIHNILIFFAEKMWVAFALQKLHFFSKKFQHICVSLHVNFNESLTNDIVSFEQLGPDKHHIMKLHKEKLQQTTIIWLWLYSGIQKKDKRKVQGVPQSQTAALPRHQEEEETDKTKHVQTKQTYKKHQD